MKLELKHLAPYLPYGLKLNVFNLLGDLVHTNRELTSFDINLRDKQFYIMDEIDVCFFLDSIKSTNQKTLN